MKNLWLYFLPLLFLPNWGTQRLTALGTLQISDYLIGPYLFLLILAIGKSHRYEKLLASRLVPFMLMFLLWILIVTLLVPIRYSYATNDALFIGLLKVAKLVLYAAAGMLTIKALTDNDVWSKLNWSLLVSGFIVGLNLLITRSSFNEHVLPNLIIEQAYLGNFISTIVAILTVYLLGLRLADYGTRAWRWVLVVSLVVMTLGTFLSNGRGGWVAALVGLSYLLYRQHLRRTLLAILLGMILVLLAYEIFPTFEAQVDHTLRPDQAYLARYEMGIAGIDDGARLNLLRKEGAKLFEDPVLGRGFFHRAGKSGLSWFGSHNFFVQMFLETGIVGGLLILGILWGMWRQAGSEVALAAGVEVPVKAALLTGFIGGLSGEYYYGGVALFTVLLVYGAVGRLPYIEQLDVHGQDLSAQSSVMHDHQVPA